MSITGTVPVKVPEKTGDYEVYGLLAAGLAAARPAPGIVGRFYFSTDTLVLERDTGAAWDEVVRGEAATRLAQLAEKAHLSLTGIGPSDHHVRYTDAEAVAVANALIAIHAALADVHHVRYTDAEAQAVANALIAIHAALTDAHHARSHDHSLAADGSPIAVAGVPNLDAAKITSGTFAVARGGTGLNTIALGGILYASALDVLSRLAPTAANQVLRSTAANALQFAALLAADIPNLAASKITSGQFPLSRMPRAASGLFLEGNGAADPIYNALVAANIPNLDTSKITTGTFPVARGGTGLSTIALGGILYASALDVLSRLAPTAANQVLRSTAANALQFAALLAADIPNLDTAKITSGVFALARIPNMDWAHISGLFPRTIADLLSDHNLAHHGLGTIVPHDALASLTEKAHGSLTGVTANQHHAQAHTLASHSTKAHTELTGVTSDQHHGRSHDHSVAGDGTPIAVTGVPNLAASKITSGRFPVDRLPAMTDEKIWKGTGGNVEEVDMPSGVPSGVIAIWHGLIANIPSGWVICDGNSGTPNLLARFVEGVATAATDPSATGGATTKYLTHGAVAKASSISDQIVAPTGHGILIKKGAYTGYALVYDDIADIRPKYYDIAFIMKT